ncbi:MAG: hypothetical protein LBU89_13110 [Fibromonadaceae bacterium]|jgi:signal transduction histidine kinase|nr:hypothetical protein [Fibromonadaceae bacterium]
MIKMTFQKKLILSFLLIFAFCVFGIVVFEHQRAMQYKKDALEERLDAYVGVVANLVANDQWPIADGILPSNLRVTLMNLKGDVQHDNVLSDYSTENRSSRPEVSEAMKKGKSSSLRSSASNNVVYLYYAKRVNNNIIRTALPYDKRVQLFLQPNNEFLYFIVFIFLIGFGFILYVGNYFGKSIRQLRDFSQTLSNGTEDVVAPKFPANELGEIGAKIVENLHRIKEDEKRLEQEKEKLLLHVQASAEGICFFKADRTVAFYNGLFLQYFNVISHDSMPSKGEILRDKVFAPVLDFLDNRMNEDYFETRLSRHGSEFSVRINTFPDKSFEIILANVTAIEKNKRLKQEMTGNIAHELRTPVTSIRGFLEIILNNDINEEKRKEFLERAFSQTQVLSELISDMSLLTKMDEKAEVHSSNVNVCQLLQKVQTDTASALAEKSILFNAGVPEDLFIVGNESLFYSIFRNLTDNAIRHAGENISINIRVHEIRDGMVYFVFADTGKGLEKHIPLERLFERFYRVSEGRTRETGGSGLGLSIVKNAVLFHKGTITARNGRDNGLEFMFSLPHLR